MGAIFVAGILIIVVASRTDFFKGSLQNVPETNIHKSAESKVGTLVVDYIKVPDKNEIQIGAKEELLGKNLFKVQNESIIVEALTFEMEGNIKKENFANLKLKIAEKNVENAEFLWIDENSLLVDMSADNVEIKDNTEVELTGDISAGEKGQMFAFHFVDIDASGKITGGKIESIGVDGSVAPMPQIHILK